MRKHDSGNWHMKARLLKYHEDIDSFAHRTTWWAKSLRRLSTIWLISFLAVALYDQTVGRLERKFHALFTPYEVIEMEGNCLLNTGIDKIWDLVTGVVSGADHIYDGPTGNDKAQIGVGDSATAAQATDTDLIGTATYKTMETGYPTSENQKATFKSSFGSGDANYAWNEWVVKQVTSGDCLNRKVESLGTKSTGTWTLEVDITLS